MRITSAISFSSSSLLRGVQNYSSASICTGSLIRRYTDSNGQIYLSPIRPTINRLYDNLGYVLETRYMSAISWNNDVDYIFMIQPGASSALSRIILTKYSKAQNTFSPLGSIQINPQVGATANRTFNAIKGYLYRYSSGSVQVNANTVTGSSTFWATNRIFQGSRVGFGTNDPTQVSTWYEIIDLPSETNFTISGTASFSASTPYVIEELKLFVPYSHTTATFNGLYTVHGIHEDVFSLAGTTINPTTSSLQDRYRGFIRSTDRLSASVIVGGYEVELEPPVSPTEQYAYLMSSNATTFQFFKHNILRPISASAFSGSFLFSASVEDNFVAKTETFTAATNTTFNLINKKIDSGSGSGSFALYTIGTGNGTTVPGRVYRILTSNIISGSTAFVEDNMVEVPPGSSETMNLTGFTYADYCETSSRFYIQGTTTQPYNKMLITPYNTSLDKFERHALNGVGALSKLTSDPNMPNIFYINNTRPNFTIRNGMMYVTAGSGSNGTYILYNFPVGADYKNTPNSKQWVVFPSIDTTGAQYYYNVSVLAPRYIGGNDSLGFPPERLKIYYRTTGIGNDTGAWSEVRESGDLSYITVANAIQFAVAFDVFGNVGLPNWLYGLNFTYEDGSQDSHYQPSVGFSNIASSSFAWRQSQAWGSNIPNLRLRLYNDSTNFLLLEDTTSTQTQGTFQYSQDSGSTWNAWDASKDQIGNYIRYNANSLPANTVIRALLTIA